MSENHFFDTNLQIIPGHSYKWAKEPILARHECGIALPTPDLAIEFRTDLYSSLGIQKSPEQTLQVEAAWKSNSYRHLVVMCFGVQFFQPHRHLLFILFEQVPLVHWVRSSPRERRFVARCASASF